MSVFVPATQFNSVQFIMIGAHKGLKPVLISELNDPFEILVIEIEVGNKEIRIISGYGPQESWTSQQREPFFLECLKKRL